MTPDTLATVASQPTGAQFISLCVTVGLMAFFITTMFIGGGQK